MSQHYSSRLTLVGLICLSLGLAACGSDNAATLSVFKLTANDGKFTPETIDVPAGQKFTLLVNNAGTTAEEFESSDLSVEKVITPGGQIELTLGPLTAGNYRFVGEFHSDTAKGTIVAK